MRPERGASGPAPDQHFLPRVGAVTCLSIEGQSLMHPPNNPWKSGFLCLFTDRETESQGGSTAGWETERRDSETLTGSRPQVEATAVCPSSALPPLLSASLQVRPREPPTSGFLGSSPPSPSGLAQHVLRKPARASEPELSGPDLPLHRVLFI